MFGSSPIDNFDGEASMLFSTLALVCMTAEGDPMSPTPDQQYRAFD